MNKFKKYQDDVFKFAKVGIYITDKTDDMEKEIYENCVKIGVPDEHLENISASLFQNLLYQVKQNAKRNLDTNSLSVDLIFYVWFDAQAGQLRYNFLNSNHERLPFIAEFQLVDDVYEICDLFVKCTQTSTAPPQDKLLVFRQILTKKKIYEFIPYESVGLLKFGMSMEEARKAVNLPYKSFQKSNDVYSPADAFDDSAMIVFYDKNDNVEAIECYPEIQLKLKEVELLGKPIPELKKWLKTIANDVKKDDLGNDIRSLGFSFSGSGDGNPYARKVGYIFVYRKGYWDEYEASLPKIYVFKPQKSVGPIKFGMTKAAVRKAIASPFVGTNYKDDAQNLADDFETLGIRVLYKNGKCYYVQFTNADRINIKYDFVQSMNSGGLTGLIDFLKQRDPDIKFDSIGCESMVLGLNIANLGYLDEATRYSQMNSISCFKD